MVMIKCRVMAIAALMGCMSSASAWAQEAEQPQASSDVVSDIVVTATRRSESIQKVPVAVTAVGTEQMERLQITNLADIGAAAPNTTVFRNPSSSSTSTLYIRGIGDDSSNILREFPVSQYIDGVYVGRNLGSLLDLVGLERVEILRGPQGTLYGRNSTGGALKLVTKRPDFDEFGVKGDVTLGSFDRRDVRLLVNLPLADTLAVNVSAGSSTNDGFYNDVNTGRSLNRQNVQTVRAGLRWEPSDKLDVYLTGDYTHDNSGLQVPTQMSATTGPGMNVPLYGGYYDAAPDQPDLNRVNGWGTSLEINYDLGFGKLQSISAYRGVDFVANYDYGGAPIGPDLLRDTSQWQISQELQFASQFQGPFQVIAGLFYYHEVGKGYEGFVFSPGGAPYPYAFSQKSDSYAAYAEGTLNLTDWLSATAGLRLTHDSKRMKRINVFDGLGADDDWTKFTPKVGLKAQINPNLMTYATYSKGYKAGIYLPFPGNADAAVTALPPEGVDAFEVGVKGDWFGGKLRTNLALFHNKYTDLQIGVLTSGGATGAVSADERAQGIELEVTAKPVRNLYLYGTFTYLDTEFTRVPTGNASYPALGDMQRFSPPYSVKVGGDFDIPLGNGDIVRVGASYSWFDEQAQGFPNSINMMDSYDLIDARIEYRPDNAHWGVEFGAKNIGNTRYWTYQSYLAGYARYYAPGRTWSLRLKFDI